MKKMFTKNVSVAKSFAVLSLVTGSLLSVSAYAQSFSYTSKFADPTMHYSKTDPTCTNAAPAIQDIANIATLGTNNPAYFDALNVSQSYDCSNRYQFIADLNMGAAHNAVPAGQQGGFRVRINNGINKDSLGKYLTVTTYLRDSVNRTNVTFQEYATGGGSSGVNLYGIDLDQSGKNWYIYFTTAKPFNLLELAVDPKIIQLNVDFRFEVFYAFGGAASQVLPAQIANFKALVSGKSVNLLWQSLTEINVSSYRIERSEGNGTYTTVGTIAAKGTSSAALSYSFTDKVSVNGNYLYRIVTVNNDGTIEATGSLSAIINSLGKLLLYPTMVKAGGIVTVKTSESGVVNAYFYDVQGRLVKQQRTTSSGQFAIPTAGLNSGIYNVKIVSAGGSVLQSKIIVN